MMYKKIKKNNLNFNKLQINYNSVKKTKKISRYIINIL